MQNQKSHVHKDGGGQCLKNGNDGGLAADVLQLLQPEFIADGEGDEAQGNITDEPQLFHEVKARQAQVGDAQGAQAQRPNQHAGNQIAGHVRQVEFGGQTGQKQSCEHGKTDGKQVFHKEMPLFI